MSTHHTQYFRTLFEAVLEGKKIDEAPLAMTERIHKAIQPYLQHECQSPQPPLHEV